MTPYGFIRSYICGTDTQRYIRLEDDKSSCFYQMDCKKKDTRRVLEEAIQAIHRPCPFCTIDAL
jgi:hypothetical protein